MIIRIKLAVAFAADFALCFLGAGDSTAGMPSRINLLIAVSSLMAVMPPCMNRLDFCHHAFVTGICIFATIHTGRRGCGHAVVPIVRLFAVYCVTARAFLPVFVAIMLLFGEVVTESRNRSAALGADNRSRAVGDRGAGQGEYTVAAMNCHVRSVSRYNEPFLSQAVITRGRTILRLKNGFELFSLALGKN